MNNLKVKILIILISILTLFLITITIVYNTSIYTKESNDLKDKILLIDSSRDKFKFKDGFNPMLLENEVYEIIIGKNGNIDKIISYSPDGLDDNEVIELINKNIDLINDEKPQSLYFNDYIFTRSRNGNLYVISNKHTKDYLLIEVYKSIILFIILEIIIVFISIKITKWIVKPVNDAFLKQRQFIYDASHELKTPIAIIGASAETLEKEPKNKKWLENIKSENQRMNKLVTDLLELSRTEDMREKEVYSEVELSKLVENKALSFESLMFESNLSLDLDITPNIMLSCNQDRIKELLSILLDNAIKHGYKDSKIVVKLYKDKNNIYLEVINNGDEIQIQDRTKIFERFYRVDKSRNRNEGRYGLGLAIAKNIVEQHNGNIDVDCKNGYTTFKDILKKK